MFGMATAPIRKADPEFSWLLRVARERLSAKREEFSGREDKQAVSTRLDLDAALSLSEQMAQMNNYGPGIVDKAHLLDLMQYFEEREDWLSASLACGLAEMAGAFS